MRLPQDLIDRGGPGEMTVRRIEKAETTAIRNKTKTQLEHALDWPSGTVDELLAGNAEPTQMATYVVRPGASMDRVRGAYEAARGSDSATVHVKAGAAAALGGLSAAVVGPASRAASHEEVDHTIFMLASQLVPLLASRSPSSPASRAAVTNLVDVMGEIANSMIVSDED